MMAVREFAPAKINLTLHVTGQRDDGYHLLDSLVVFADVGDWVSVSPSDQIDLTVVGPMADGVPVDDSNIVIKTAMLLGVTAHIRLEKHLPHAAGLGGGSSDAAATLKALARLNGISYRGYAGELGADVPVCIGASAARMQGVGEVISPINDLPLMHAVLVNPRLPVLTSDVFKRLKNHQNQPMLKTLPKGLDTAGLVEWLGRMRNDLEAPAIKAEPVIEQIFSTLAMTPGCLLTRMSGSGGTCFGLYADEETAASAAGRLQEENPGWWVTPTQLNAVN